MPYWLHINLSETEGWMLREKEIFLSKRVIHSIKCQSVPFHLLTWQFYEKGGVSRWWVRVRLDGYAPFFEQGAYLAREGAYTAYLQITHINPSNG